MSFATRSAVAAPLQGAAGPSGGLVEASNPGLAEAPSLEALLDAAARAPAPAPAGRVARVDASRRGDYPGGFDPVETFADRVARDGSLNELDAVGWALRLARALEGMHAAGQVHGAVSPLAVITAAVDRNARGALLTPAAAPRAAAYRSPERGLDGPASVYDDVWAAGATLYLALTGTAPFSATSEVELVDRIAKQVPPPLAVFDVGDDDLQRILDAALSRDLAVRIRSARGLREELERWHPDPGARTLPGLDFTAEVPSEEAQITALGTVVVPRPREAAPGAGSPGSTPSPSGIDSGHGAWSAARLASGAAGRGAPTPGAADSAGGAASLGGDASVGVGGHASVGGASAGGAASAGAGVGGAAGGGGVSAGAAAGGGGAASGGGASVGGAASGGGARPGAPASGRGSRLSALASPDAIAAAFGSRIIDDEDSGDARTLSATAAAAAQRESMRMEVGQLEEDEDEATIMRQGPGALFAAAFGKPATPVASAAHARPAASTAPGMANPVAPASTSDRVPAPPPAAGRANADFRLSSERGTEQMPALGAPVPVLHPELLEDEDQATMMQLSPAALRAPVDMTAGRTADVPFASAAGRGHQMFDDDEDQATVMREIPVLPPGFGSGGRPLPAAGAPPPQPSAYGAASSPPSSGPAPAPPGATPPPPLPGQGPTSAWPGHAHPGVQVHPGSHGQPGSPGHPVPAGAFPPPPGWAPAPAAQQGAHPWSTPPPPSSMHPGPPSAAPVPGIGGWKTRPPEPQPNTTRLFIAAIIAVIVAGTATFLVLRARRVGEAPRPVGTERVCQLSPAAVARCAPMG